MHWREVIGKHQSALADELAGLWEAQKNAEVAAAHSVYAEKLNQNLRRFRQAAGDSQVLDLLRECCTPCARKLTVLLFDQARTPVARFGGQTIELSTAPAVVSAIESRDLIVTIGSESQLSPALAKALWDEDGDVDDKAYLFPVVVRQAVVAVVAAAGEPDAARIELLCEAAAMRLESLAPVTVESGKSSEPERNAWNALSPEDQKLHLQAQRMVRVRVAEWRIYQENELRKGVDECDVYHALQPHIDVARKEFLNNYLSKTGTMVDYLHLEIVRNLVNDDDALLGPDYPGPMV